MTHIENIPHILENGITHKNSPHSNPEFVTIGDLSLIRNRNSIRVSVDNGDLHQPIEKITLGDYIPFYFGVKMPMLYVMQNGGNFVEKATPAENIIYVVCSLERVVNENLTYYFSDGHATDGLTTFYNGDKIDELPQIIDWNSVKALYWGGEDNLNTKRKKQAEFLVDRDLSTEMIVGFGCYNNTARRNLLDMGVDKRLTKVIPKSYY